MPDLLDRLLGLLPEGQSALSISWVAFRSAVREQDRGNLARGQVFAALGITSPSEMKDYDTIFNAIFASKVITVDELSDLLCLAATRNRGSVIGAAYYIKVTVKARLGL